MSEPILPRQWPPLEHVLFCFLKSCIYQQTILCQTGFRLEPCTMLVFALLTLSMLRFHLHFTCSAAICDTTKTSKYVAGHARTTAFGRLLTAVTNSWQDDRKPFLVFVFRTWSRGMFIWSQWCAWSSGFSCDCTKFSGRKTSTSNRKMRRCARIFRALLCLYCSLLVCVHFPGNSSKLNGWHLPFVNCVLQRGVLPLYSEWMFSVDGESTEPPVSRELQYLRVLSRLSQVGVHMYWACVCLCVHVHACGCVHIYMHSSQLKHNSVVVFHGVSFSHSAIFSPSFSPSFLHLPFLKINSAMFFSRQIVSVKKWLTRECWSCCTPCTSHTAVIVKPRCCQKVSVLWPTWPCSRVYTQRFDKAVRG